MQYEGGGALPPTSRTRNLLRLSRAPSSFRRERQSPPTQELSHDLHERLSLSQVAQAPRMGDARWREVLSREQKQRFVVDENGDLSGSVQGCWQTRYRAAGRAFGSKEKVARARCRVAEAEIALASRDLSWPERELQTAREVLERGGDRLNAAHAGFLQLRRRILIGHLDEADNLIADFDPTAFPPTLRAAYELAVAAIAMRRIRAGAARAVLLEAKRAALQAAIPALIGEVEEASRLPGTPAARLIAGGRERPLLREEVEALLQSPALLVDACRNAVRGAGCSLSLATRPVLFALARTLAEAWPGEASRAALLERAFGARFVDESHRMRLRVEIGRLRRLLRPVAGIVATRRGFTLSPHTAMEVVVLARPLEEAHAAVLAFLADGESWSSSALAIALGTSQRSIRGRWMPWRRKARCSPSARGGRAGG